MPDFRFSVIIPTYNRSRFVGRSIGSAIEQGWPDLEIVVVDDASTDDTAEAVRRSFPQVRYFRQSSNRGQCEARNRGIREASCPWLVLLDDDDVLLPGALAQITTHIQRFTNFKLYPAFQFAYLSNKMVEPFVCARLAHYIEGSIRGDFLAVINRERFMAERLAYPEAKRAGERIRSGENLLWWRVAEQYGIPTWAEAVAAVHTDAPARNTSTSYQLAHARDFAELHDRTLEEFGAVLAERFPAYYEQRRLGAATYWMLAGERATAQARLRQLLKGRISRVAWGLWALSWMPRALAKQCFIAYRRYVSGWDA